MRVKFSDDVVTTTHHFRAGREYNLPPEIAAQVLDTDAAEQVVERTVSTPEVETPERPKRKRPPAKDKDSDG